jgi:hypothetical protein
MRSLLATAVFVACALPAAATQVRNCDYAADVRNIVEPWESNTRAFYNRNVRVALVDTGGEPVCCSQHLVILMPDRATPEGMDEGRVCRVVGNRDNMGFLGIEFQRMRSSYDKRGLLLEFPVHIYGDGIRNQRSIARVRIDLNRGTVTPE